MAMNKLMVGIMGLVLLHTHEAQEGVCVHHQHSPCSSIAIFLSFPRCGHALCLSTRSTL